jgi:hypothetical protein
LHGIIDYKFQGNEKTAKDTMENWQSEFLQLIWHYGMWGLHSQRRLMTDEKKA